MCEARVRQQLNRCCAEQTRFVGGEPTDRRGADKDGAKAARPFFSVLRAMQLAGAAESQQQQRKPSG